MARPQDIELKNKIREARMLGASIEDLMSSFSLSRNTIFYHLRADPKKDGREHYSKEERAKIAHMTDEELSIYARAKGKTFVALQRVAYRERKRQREEAETSARTRIELRGWVDFGMQSELLLAGLDEDQVALANRKLAPFRLRLTAPNKLETTDGRKYCAMKLRFQQAVVRDPVATIMAHAEKIKQAWVTIAGCPACGAEVLGLMSRKDGSMYRVCSCGWSADTGKVEKRVETRRQGYRSEWE